MNKRIEALITQCTETKFTEDRAEFRRFNKERFAELIIKECAHRARLNSTEDNVSHEKIKQHFGIKE